MQKNRSMQGALIVFKNMEKNEAFFKVVISKGQLVSFIKE